MGRSSCARGSCLAGWGDTAVQDVRASREMGRGGEWGDTAVQDARVSWEMGRGVVWGGGAVALW